MGKENYTRIIGITIAVATIFIISGCSSTYLTVTSSDFRNFDLPIYEDYYATDYIILGPILVETNATVELTSSEEPKSYNDAMYYRKQKSDITLPVPPESLIKKMVEEAKKLGAEGIINFKYRYEDGYIQTLSGYAVKWVNPAEKY